ncbi:MAG: glycosyltransferase family 2 protein [Proteobacteria bacterium]|nr:glycosyltransferase family 2 protein [Pseudomonadota bacterium]
MARIIDITPRAQEVRPVLMLLTSHRVDCLLLCLKCLELFTDLDRFKKIYIVANDVGDEHAVIIKSFQRKHANVIDVHATPRGQIPAMLSMENFILRRHKDDVVLRLSEDVFVTPYWLEHLLATYKLHRGHEDIVAISALTPISRTGRQLMDRVLRTHYPDLRKRLPTLPLEQNAVYHRFVWEKILGDGLAAKYLELTRPKHIYMSRVSVDCLLFDGQLIERLVPMPLRLPEGTTRADEFYINSVLRSDGLRVAVVTDALVHHFSHAGPEAYLRKHISMDDIWWHMTFLESHGSASPKAVFRPRPGKGNRLELLRLIKERELRVLQ